MTSAIYGAAGIRYRDGTIYRGLAAQQPQSTVTQYAPRTGAELRVYDGNGVVVGLISSEWGEQRLLSAKATVTPSGPGTLTFSLDRLPDWTMTHGTRVDLHLQGSISPLWSGYLQQVPSALSTSWPLDYEAVGYRARLAGIIIPGQVYEDQRIYEVVEDVVSRYITPAIPITHDPSLISRKARYTLGDYRPERATLTSVLDDLRDMAGLYDWGVDASRRFFFTPQSDEVLHHWWVGQHLTGCTAEEDSSKLANRVWIKMGKRLALTDDQWISYPLDDASSQAVYGVRETTITAPSVYTEADAVRLASVTLAERRAPVVRLRLRGLEYTEPIPCRGRARVVAADGSTEETRPLKQVSYTVGPARIEVSVELGDRDPDVGRWLAGWAGQQDRLEQLQQAAQRQTAIS